MSKYIPKKSTSPFGDVRKYPDAKYKVSWRVKTFAILILVALLFLLKYSI